jgi:hypothetical protein
MEVGPSLYNPEVEQDPDLLREFADMEITVFGKTGTLDNLAREECPVDLDDPRVTPEMKNVFVVKAINLAGSAVDQKYEAYFTKVLDEHGVERKFTVAEQREAIEQPKPQSEPERVKASTELPIPVQRTLEPEQVVQTAVLVALPQQHVGEASLAHADITVPDEVVREIARHDEPPEEFDTIRLASEVQAVTGVAASSDAEASPLLDVPQVEIVTMQILKEYEERLSNDAYTETEKIVDEQAQVMGEVVMEGEGVVRELTSENTPAPEVLVATMEEVLGLPEGDGTELAIDPFMEPLVLPMIVEESGSDVDIASLLTVELLAEPEDIWLAELHKEPTEIVDDIAAALLALSAQQESAGFIADVTDGTDSGLEDATYSVVPETRTALLPAVVGLVAEQLRQLEPEAKETVSPIIKNIAGAIHAIHVLEARQSEPEVVARIQIELEAFCAQLFEAIGIEYDEDMVRQFAFVVSRPDFMAMPQTAQLTEADLEYDGTREAKRGLHATTTNLPVSDRPLERLLGVLAMLYLMTVRKAQSQMMPLES